MFWFQTLSSLSFKEFNNMLRIYAPETLGKRIKDQTPCSCIFGPIIILNNANQEKNQKNQLDLKGPWWAKPTFKIGLSLMNIDEYKQATPIISNAKVKQAYASLTRILRVKPTSKCGFTIYFNWQAIFELITEIK